MLIDLCLPDYDATEVAEVVVDAPADETYDAIRETNLADPVIAALFIIRELPARVAARMRGEPRPPAPPEVTFGEMTSQAPGWELLEEAPGRELVIGSVGRFWRRDYGGRPIRAEEFAGFDEPGYAKLAVSFMVRPVGDRRSVLRYEARTATTEDEARRQFRRYWRMIRPGVAIVMRRALRLIKAEAEQRQLTGVGLV